MKKTIKLRDLDCANCAAKIEHEISKIEGVNSVSVNFIMQKMVLDTDDALFDIIMEKSNIIAKKIEPDISFVGY